MIQTNMKRKSHGEEGISLIIVLLVGTLILLASLSIGDFALRTVNSLRTRGDATRALYSAEQTFECIKYWLNKDYRYFTNEAPDPSVPQDPTCNGVTYVLGSNMTYDVEGGPTATGTARFSIPNNEGGENKVEVIRFNRSLQFFNGLIRISSQTSESGSDKVSERFQEYKYRVLYGADIMFVVDRSGSIDRNTPPSGGDSEWDEMTKAVSDSINTLRKKVPKPNMGILSFGTSPEDTGRKYPAAGLTEGILADVSLTDNVDSLINDNGTPQEDDDFPNFTTTNPGATNIPLALGIAGSELMGKMYPYTGLRPALSGGTSSGGFEDNVINGGNFSNLPLHPNPGMDRDDESYPDVIVLLTDGVPNGFISTDQKEWFVSKVDSFNEFFVPTAHTFSVGETKLFRTEEPSSDWLIIDNDGDIPIDPLIVIPAGLAEFNYCHDQSLIATNRPSSVMGGGYQNEYPDIAICNTTLTADRLKDLDMSIIVIYVDDTGNVGSHAAEWLRTNLASQFQNSEGQTEYLFALVTDYKDVRSKLLEQFEKLEFLQNI